MRNHVTAQLKLVIRIIAAKLAKFTRLKKEFAYKLKVSRQLVDARQKQTTIYSSEITSNPPLLLSSAAYR